MSCLQCINLQRIVNVSKNIDDNWYTANTEYYCAVKCNEFPYHLQQSLAEQPQTDCEDYK